MLIPTRVFVANDPFANGVRLWVISTIDRTQAWFKWYEHTGVVGPDAVQMQMAERVTGPTSSPYVLNVSYKIFPDQEMDTDELARSWTKGDAPLFPEI
jgi:hypothetical protein